MSIRQSLTAAAVASALLAGCGPPPQVNAPAGQSYAIVSKSFDGDLKAYASQVSVDTVLSNAGAVLVDSVLYPDCPGLAGLQTYRQEAKHRIIEVAFTVSSGKAIAAIYGRDAGAKPDPGVMKSMTATICQL